jgi:hypothetical protein
MEERLFTFLLSAAAAGGGRISREKSSPVTDKMWETAQTTFARRF